MQAKQNTIFILKEYVKKNGWVDIPSEGTSMYPLIQEGDICRFSIIEPSEMKQGDIILFQSNTGKLVAHRYISSKIYGNHLMFLFKGDSNLGLDDPITESQIVGKLIYVRKNKLKITNNHIFYMLWKKLILSFPILSGYIRSFLNRRQFSD